MSFGGVAVDQVGPTRRFPAASALTGLIGNALGLDWSDRAAHQNLQERLIFASALIREGHLLTDSQNAQLSKTDKGWTTRGMPEGRDGASYGAPHRRRRDYLADAELRVVLRLTEGRPDLDMLAEALNRPARPLFIGRKPCLPSRPMLGKTRTGLSPPPPHTQRCWQAVRQDAPPSGPRARGPQRGRGAPRLCLARSAQLAHRPAWRQPRHLSGATARCCDMSLFLISLPLRPSALALWAGERGWTRPRGGDFDAGRALHHLLSESFGKGAL